MLFLQTDMDTPPPPLSQSTPRNIYAFGLTSFLNDTASEMAYWVLPAFLASLGAGAAQLGIIEGIAESVASFAQLFSGYLADRVSHRKPIVVGGYFVANAVNPLLALAVIGRFGMRGVFAWAAIPGALCVVVAWVGIREQFVERRASSPVKAERSSATAISA